MGRLFVLSLSSALNPTLLTATTLMLLLPSPRRLMLGYLTGALFTSITLGLVIVFAIEGSSSVKTTQRTLSPAADLALAAIAIVVAVVLATERDARLRERRQRRAKGPKDPPRWQRKMSEGSPRTALVVGALLTLPGASYLAGLHHLRSLDYPTGTTVLAVIGFNLVMLMALELPLISFSVAPDWTPIAIERGRTWVRSRRRRVGIYGFSLVGVALAVKGLVGLLS